MELSVCYIVKNEAMNLPESIFNIRDDVDEICILDTGSEDGTKEYAKAIADQYADFKWCDDFSMARNESLKLATKDWILILDADEWVNKPDFEKIKSILKDSEADAFYFTIWNFLQDPRWIQNSQPLYGKAIRLFRNHKGFKYEGLVHNKLKIDKAKVKDSKLGIINLNFKERHKVQWKCDQNKRLMDKKIKLEGWNFLNYIHYSDIYRKLWTWKGQIEDGEQCVHYLNLALKEKFDDKITAIRNKILKEVNHVKSKSNGDGSSQDIQHRIFRQNKIQKQNITN